MRRAHIPTALAAAALLGACGGGGDFRVPPPASDVVPSSATASPSAYTQYLRSLPASDTSEPLVVDSVTPPTSDTAEPADV